MVKKLALVAAVGLATASLAVFYAASAQDYDAFAAKYRLIRPEMTLAQAAQLLGPPDDELHLGGPCFGDHIYFWLCPDGERYIQVTWSRHGTVSDKRIVTKDGRVVSKVGNWWERCLDSVGLY